MRGSTSEAHCMILVDASAHSKWFVTTERVIATAYGTASEASRPVEAKHRVGFPAPAFHGMEESSGIERLSPTPLVQELRRLFERRPMLPITEGERLNTCPPHPFALGTGGGGNSPRTATNCAIAAPHTGYPHRSAGTAHKSEAGLAARLLISSASLRCGAPWIWPLASSASE